MTKQFIFGALALILLASPILAVAATPPSCPTLARTLARGAHGTDVSALQQFLGVTPATGYFGSITAQAVGKLQISRGIVSSAIDPSYGFVGPKTRTAIAVSCEQTSNSTPRIPALTSVATGGSASGGGGNVGGGGTTTPPASCTFNSQSIASGSSVTTYQQSSVPSGQQCVSETRACSNGTLSGSLQYLSCSVSAAQGMHRIGIRRVMSGSEFYDTQTGAKFVPRGNNYLRLSGVLLNDTFDPSVYDGVRVENALELMHADGYNVVRIATHSIAMVGSLSAPGLDSAYMANVLDFLHRASKNHIYVYAFGGLIPQNYQPIVSSSPVPANVTGMQVRLMHQGSINALTEVWKDFVSDIKASDPNALSDIFAYEIYSEPEYSAADAPFSLTTGTVTPADGKTYDLSSTSSRQALADDSAIYWANSVRAGIKAEDHDALVTTGVFAPLAVGRNGLDGAYPSAQGNRVPLRPAALQKSALDFLDIHVYPSDPNATAAQVQLILASAEVPALNTTKPRIIGEYGALKSWFNNDLNAAASSMAATQAASCAAGFSGWLLWTWDTAEQPDLWNALDNGGTLERALAPSVRPDPCAAASPPPSSTPIFGAAQSNDVLTNWPAENAIDRQPGSVYSSKLFATDLNDRATFLAAWVSNGLVTVSQIILTARMYNGAPTGFPQNYSIALTDSDNKSWVTVGDFAQQPDASGVVRIALNHPYSTYGILITPRTIGTDPNGDHYFQLAEVGMQ
jgi:hypothetical protein